MTQRPQGPLDPADGSGRPEATPADAGTEDARPTAEPIRQYGDPVLRAKARPIRRINAAIRDLAKRMADTMYTFDGVGLAAPQIGESRRIVVYDIGEGLVTLINPRIVSAEGAQSDVEACLSVHGLNGDVERYLHVRVKALDIDGKEVTIDAEGYLARVLQHELDHLDGILYIDRAFEIRASSRAEQEAGEPPRGDGDDLPEGDRDDVPEGDPR